MSLSSAGSGVDLRAAFHALTNARDVADLLEVSHSALTWHIYRSPKDKRYVVFDIPKRAGGVRSISAPASPLKMIQRKLNLILQEVYQPRACVYGFTRHRNIVDNSRIHTRKRYVLNLDLEDFFPSINFGRVRGMFMGAPYKLADDVATVLAQICCHNNQLPQGAPTSPVVSNMVCAKLDAELQRLANSQRCTFSRYADDLTFSTGLRKFPQSLARYFPDPNGGGFKLGGQLRRVIQHNGFSISDQKTRLQIRQFRQQVTGLTVNERPNVRRKYVRQIRAMLHAWETYGLNAAQQTFRSDYDRKRRSVYKTNPSFKRVVRGKIEFLSMVRGASDPLYLKYLSEFTRLSRLGPP